MSELKPTPEQQAIIDAAVASGDNLLVEALAGTAKTTTLTMLANALPPQRALALAFNVHTKKDLERVMPEHFTVLNLNGLGHRAWMRAVRNKVTLEKRKAGQLITKLMKEAGLEDPEGDIWDSARRLLDLARHAGLVPSKFSSYRGLVPDTPEQWADLAEEHDIEAASWLIELVRFALIESINQAYSGFIDFTDQIYMPTLFGAGFPKFDLVLGDEVQDWSPLNQRMVMKTIGKRFIGCGDRHQSIYAFRGADHNAMDHLGAALKCRSLPLTVTFRCAEAIVKENWDHVPSYRARPDAPSGSVERLGEWSLSDLPRSAAVLCRNNAPLIALAFKLLRNGRGVYYVGGDFGKGLERLVRKLSATAVGLDELTTRIGLWRQSEEDKARSTNKEHKLAGIADKAESLKAVVESSGATDSEGVIAHIKRLFDGSSGPLTLSTGHRFKGQEADTVFFLDPWRIPSRFARDAAERGNRGPLIQEFNLRYVIRTRAKQRLVYVNLEKLND